METKTYLIQCIKDNYRDNVYKIINDNNIDFNWLDNNGNNILMLLLKYKYYDIVINSLDNVIINHQNNDGDTLAHLVFSMNYLEVKDIIVKLLNNKRLILNIKNNNGETILDKSINYSCLYTTNKIISDKRFINIDLLSFKNLFDTYIKSSNYGKYSKISNYQLIMDSLNVKKLLPKMDRLFKLLKRYQKDIINDLSNSSTSKLGYLIDYAIKSY